MLDKNTELEIDANGSAAKVVIATHKELVLKTGSVWCKFQKTEQPFRNTAYEIKG